MEIEGLGWLAGGGDRRVWDRWEMGSFDERERDYMFWLFLLLLLLLNRWYS